jgi:hypothetical protein
MNFFMVTVYCYLPRRPGAPCPLLLLLRIVRMYLLVCSARPEARSRRKKEARSFMSPATPPQDSKDVPVGLLARNRR